MTAVVLPGVLGWYLRKMSEFSSRPRGWLARTRIAVAYSCRNLAGSSEHNYSFLGQFFDKQRSLLINVSQHTVRCGGEWPNSPPFRACYLGEGRLNIRVIAHSNFPQKETRPSTVVSFWGVYFFFQFCCFFFIGKCVCCLTFLLLFCLTMFFSSSHHKPTGTKQYQSSDEAKQRSLTKQSHSSFTTG